MQDSIHGRHFKKCCTLDTEKKIWTYKAVCNIGAAFAQNETKEMQNVSSSTVWKILHEDLLYPYHIQRVQVLLPADYPSRVIFPQWYLQQCTFPNSEVSILFTNEANFFTRRYNKSS